MPAVLTIAATDQPSHMLVSLAGECDITNAHLLPEVMTGYIPVNASLAVIDLSGLWFIDASGVHGLVGARDVLAVTGRHWCWPGRSRPWPGCSP